jgi:hypothetical protein
VPRQRRPRRQRQRPRKAELALERPTELEGLTGTQQRFVIEYDNNGGNGTRAYLVSHATTCKSEATAATNAWRMLRNAKVRSALAKLEEARHRRLQMTGDEALMLEALAARADIRELYDEQGRLLPIKHWPDSIARCVVSIRPGPFGDIIVLESKHAARRTVLEATGKLKNPVERGMLSLARLLTGDYTEEDAQ